MGGKEIPPVDLSLADIVTNELLLDAAGLHEMGRVMDHCDHGPNGLIVRQVARLGQNNHTGFNALWLITLSNLARLVRPEHEGTGIEDVTL